MRATWPDVIRVCRSAVPLLMALGVALGRADSWAPPREFESASENGQFVARVIPGKDAVKPLLLVSRIEAGQTNEVWRTILGNRVAPTSVCLSDDGEAVVTFDNWGGVGYGKDVVAIYSAKGRLAHYSLEQIHPPVQRSTESSRGSEASRSVDGLAFDAYWPNFRHSTSSRAWRTMSIEFFLNDGDQLLFCLWLDWAEQWVAWRMSDGQKVQVTAAQSARFMDEGGRWARRIAQSGAATAAALNFFGHLRKKEDRPLVEAWLKDTQFTSSFMLTSDSGLDHFKLEFVAHSEKRHTAERTLARWDRVKPKEPDFASASQHTYRFLGTLKCSVSFPVAPDKGLGVIRLYLLSAASSYSDWDVHPPVLYVPNDLKHLNLPFKLRPDGVRVNAVLADMDFVLHGVTPGRYRLKVVWDRVAPFAAPGEVLYRPQAGDYESSSSPVFAVWPGRLTEGLRIKCLSAAGP